MHPKNKIESASIYHYFADGSGIMDADSRFAHTRLKIVHAAQGRLQAQTLFSSPYSLKRFHAFERFHAFALP